MKHTFSVEDPISHKHHDVEVFYVGEHIGKGRYDISIISAKFADNGSHYNLGDEQREAWELELAADLRKQKVKPADVQS